MDMKMSTLKSKVLLESNPPKPRILVLNMEIGRTSQAPECQGFGQVLPQRVPPKKGAAKGAAPGGMAVVYSGRPRIRKTGGWWGVKQIMYPLLFGVFGLRALGCLGFYSFMV